MSKRCYICNRILSIENPTDNRLYCKSHNEHIIPNAIFGHLKSCNILCKECGNVFSNDDKKFSEIYSSIIALLRQNEKFRGRDRNNKPLQVNGIMVSSIDNSIESNTNIIYKDGEVFPKNPFYYVDEEQKKIKIYCKNSDNKNHILKNIKEEKGVDISKFIIEEIADISDKGIYGLFFSMGKEKNEFNDAMARGLSKIAVEFALDRGIPREQLKAALKIDAGSGRSEINYENIRIVPFVPIYFLDFILENNRQCYEKSYPSHSLYLFSYDNEDGESRSLYCYIDLFSTFQFYVLLNEHYDGETVCQHYAQSLLKNYNYSDDELDNMDSSDMDIIIRENNLDKSIIMKSNTYQEQIKVIKEMLRKKGPEFDIFEMKNRAYENIMNMFPFDVDQISKEFVNMIDIIIEKEFLNSHYRESFVKACIEEWNFNPERVRHYTMTVFNNLNDFCNNINREQKNGKNEDC